MHITSESAAPGYPPVAVAERERSALERAVPVLAAEIARLAGGRAAPVLVSVDLPADAVASRLAKGDAWLRTRAVATWERPAEGFAGIGLGAALRLTGEPAGTLAEAGQALRAAARQAVTTCAAPVRPRFFGGGRFDARSALHDPAWNAFSGWQFVVPQLLLVTHGGETRGSLTLQVAPGTSRVALEAAVREALRVPPPSPGATPDHDLLAPVPAEAWKHAVATAVAEIDAGRYGKTVLARQVHEPPARRESGAVLLRLARRYPDCFVFKFEAGGAAWLGASPELLVSLERGTVRASSLAGSRGRDADPTRDRRVMEDLLADPKERNEHDFVTRALRDSLAPLCAALGAPPEPRVITLPNIHHLYTPLSGVVAAGVDVLDLAAAVHPTPAVGGFPREEAIDAIRRLEGMDRGWYAGPAGWMDFDGDGEFAVALRAGLLRPDRTILFAGAGIVAGSNPTCELAETEVKLRPLREALGDR